MRIFTVWDAAGLSRNHIFFISLYSQKDCEYNFFGTKYDLNNNVGMEVGNLNINKMYQGIQGTMPLGNDIFYMNCSLGYGDNLIGRAGYIVTGILGLYSDNYLETSSLNYGAGLRLLFKRIYIGTSFTNKMGLGLSLGLYIPTLAHNRN